MFWMIVIRFFCKTETLRDFPCTLKAGIFSLKRFSLLSLKAYLIFSLHSRCRRQGKINLKAFLEIIEYVVTSPFAKVEADSDRICCTVFETVCGSSLAICAYQIGEHLHLAFANHLDLYSQQENPNFRLPSEQIPLVFWINNVLRLEYFEMEIKRSRTRLCSIFNISRPSNRSIV